MSGIKKDDSKPVLKEPEKSPQEIEQELIATHGEHHYVWMVQRFNTQRMWVWILNLVVYVAVIITYCLVPGHEIIYSMYIPLDVLLNLSKAIYYFYNYFRDTMEKKRQDEVT